MPERNEAVLEEFRRRRRRQLIATLPALLVMGFLVLRGEGEGLAFAGLPEAVVGGVFAAVFLGVLAFSLYNWRCPACRRYLGRTLNPKYCSRCGVQLR
jgi:hypothetical protein